MIETRGAENEVMVGRHASSYAAELTAILASARRRCDRDPAAHRSLYPTGQLSPSNWCCALANLLGLLHRRPRHRRTFPPRLPGASPNPKWPLLLPFTLWPSSHVRAAGWCGRLCSPGGPRAAPLMNLLNSPTSQIFKKTDALKSDKKFEFKKSN